MFVLWHNVSPFLDTAALLGRGQEGFSPVIAMLHRSGPCGFFLVFFCVEKAVCMQLGTIIFPESKHLVRSDWLSSL